MLNLRRETKRLAQERLMKQMSEITLLIYWIDSGLKEDEKNMLHITVSILVAVLRIVQIV